MKLPYQDVVMAPNRIESMCSGWSTPLKPNLLMAAQRNANRGAEGSSLFEVGPTYDNDTPKGQNLIAGGVLDEVARVLYGQDADDLYRIRGQIQFEW